ncbi:MAG: alpha-xylosidase [Clostridiales bacterium]|nr:alpha-xylosidase [Clostridiales bacterium]
MKFTDGFWLAKPGMQHVNCREVQDARWEDGCYTVYCSHVPVTERGMILNAPLITLGFRSPRAGILSVTVDHFQGVAATGPKFELFEEPVSLSVSEAEDAITLGTGTLTAVINRSPFRLSFFENGVRLTGLGDRHMGLVRTDDGDFIRVKLDVGVGEKIYGLGERFTPFVKNGQVVEIWNEDGGTASELAYKNIPFYVTNMGYGVFVNSTGKVSYELCSEAVQSAQFSLPGESLTFMVIGGGSMKKVIENYTALTGRAARLPAWSYGLWLTTSFTTRYDEQTILSFVDGMAERRIPLHVFHFDCFWMQGYEWCNFAWDRAMFPDPEGLLRKLKQRGLRVCLWINPYIAQKSPLFREARDAGYLLRRPNGDVWQWDMWQAGMGLMDFTNPDACRWFQGKLKNLLDMGVDCFKTDFGERIPTDCRYADGSDPVGMHNYYTFLYNRCVFDLLRRERGEGEAIVFARSATVGSQRIPLHWGGDSTSTFSSMAESLRAGLSLGLCGFSYWSHDISGFEDMASPEVYMRWAQFGLLSSHSRLHGSSSYRVPWLFGDRASDVVRQFVNLKCRLMPYLYAAAQEASRTGLPMMRAMALEFPGDRACEELDRQYMLGDQLLVAPVFRADGTVEYYLPQGRWTHLLSGVVIQGGAWQKERYDFDSLPLFVREGAILAMGAQDSQTDYDYLDGLEVRLYQPGPVASVSSVADAQGRPALTLTAQKAEGRVHLTVAGEHASIRVTVLDGDTVATARLEKGQASLTL